MEVLGGARIAACAVTVGDALGACGGAWRALGAPPEVGAVRGRGSSERWRPRLVLVALADGDHF
ncbi:MULTISPECIES: hypothetical protein [unclassified Streptomyces]|uniref:hypothetical protein n=1 Tax=unclassified Streptomyces TaxID=2593676 RepID=UPI000746443B|nr:MULTISPECIES: hypothetical protein [unclassified Streptomyces]KUL74116.1 hypothetical protein ADL34_18370 [Streptomyces sp. NRRL WC-3605]KUL74886.1 hypothetical protein ADL33_16265 [Streptomyces sp. NRRL WC-3604]